MMSVVILLRNGCFVNRGIIPKYLIAYFAGSVVTAYLHFRRILFFCGISTDVIRCIISGGVFQLSVSGEASLFTAVQTNCWFANFIRIS